MLGQINQSLARLSRAERKVADWVLAHPREVAGSTLAEVARAAATSEPSVIRFCRRMGLSGFREFTLRLTEALRTVHEDELAALGEAREMRRRRGGRPADRRRRRARRCCRRRLRCC